MLLDRCVTKRRTTSGACKRPWKCATACWSSTCLGTTRTTPVFSSCVDVAKLLRLPRISSSISTFDKATMVPEMLTVKPTRTSICLNICETYVFLSLWHIVCVSKINSDSQFLNEEAVMGWHQYKYELQVSKYTGEQGRRPNHMRFKPDGHVVRRAVRPVLDAEPYRMVWQAMMAVYAFNQRYDDCFRLYARMCESGIKPGNKACHDEIFLKIVKTYCKILRCCVFLCSYLARSGVVDNGDGCVEASQGAQPQPPGEHVRTVGWSCRHVCGIQCNAIQQLTQSRQS